MYRWPLSNDLSSCYQVAFVVSSRVLPAFFCSSMLPLCMSNFFSPKLQETLLPPHYLILVQQSLRVSDSWFIENKTFVQDIHQLDSGGVKSRQKWWRHSKERQKKREKELPRFTRDAGHYLKTHDNLFPINGLVHLLLLLLLLLFLLLLLLLLLLILLLLLLLTTSADSINCLRSLIILIVNTYFTLLGFICDVNWFKFKRILTG